MAKLRHIAMQVPDLEKAATFYETVFEMKRVAHGHTPYGDALMLSDGVINMALLNFPEGTKGQLNGPDWAGLHHIGFYPIGIVHEAYLSRFKRSRFLFRSGAGCLSDSVVDVLLEAL